MYVKYLELKEAVENFIKKMFFDKIFLLTYDIKICYNIIKKRKETVMSVEELQYGQYYYDPVINDIVYFVEYSDNFYWFNSCLDNYIVAYRESEIANLQLY